MAKYPKFVTENKLRHLETEVENCHPFAVKESEISNNQDGILVYFGKKDFKNGKEANSCESRRKEYSSQSRVSQSLVSSTGQQPTVMADILDHSRDNGTLTCLFCADHFKMHFT